MKRSYKFPLKSNNLQIFTFSHRSISLLLFSLCFLLFTGNSFSQKDINSDWKGRDAHNNRSTPGNRAGEHNGRFNRETREGAKMEEEGTDCGAMTTPVPEMPDDVRKAAEEYKARGGNKGRAGGLVFEIWNWQDLAGVTLAQFTHDTVRLMQNLGIPGQAGTFDSNGAAGGKTGDAIHGWYGYQNYIGAVQGAFNPDSVYVVANPSQWSWDAAGWIPLNIYTSNPDFVLDGQGNAVNGVWTNRPITNGVGFFGYIGSGYFKNTHVHIAPKRIIGKACVGGFAGMVNGDAAETGGFDIVFEDITVTGAGVLSIGYQFSIKDSIGGKPMTDWYNYGRATGGVIGQMWGHAIFKGTITAGDPVNPGTVATTNPYVNPAYTYPTWSTSYVGGLFGSVYGATLDANLNNYMTVTSEMEGTDECFGGIIGFLRSGENRYSDPYVIKTTNIIPGKTWTNYGEILGNSEVGGIIGTYNTYNTKTTILSEYDKTAAFFSDNLSDTTTQIINHSTIQPINGSLSSNSIGGFFGNFRAVYSGWVNLTNLQTVTSSRPGWGIAGIAGSLQGGILRGTITNGVPNDTHFIKCKSGGEIGGLFGWTHGIDYGQIIDADLINHMDIICEECRGEVGGISGYLQAGGFIHHNHVVANYGKIIIESPDNCWDVGGLVGDWCFSARGTLSLRLYNYPPTVFSGKAEPDVIQLIQKGIISSSNEVNEMGLFMGWCDVRNDIDITFKNFTIDIPIIGGKYIGGFAGWGSINSQVLFDNIKNEVPITGNEYVGGLIGAFSIGNTYTTTIIAHRIFRNFTNEAPIVGNDCVGGFAGCFTTSTKDTSIFTNIKNEAPISGGGNIGGIVGYMSLGGETSPMVTFTNITNSATVTGDSIVGGICGHYSNPSGYTYTSTYTPPIATYKYSPSKNKLFSNCLNAGNVTAHNNCAGGIFGNVDTLTNSYSITSGSWLYIHDYDQAYTTSTTLSNMFNTGTVTGKNFVGGIAGRLNKTITFADVITNGTSGTAAAVVGNNYVGGLFGRVNGKLNDKSLYNPTAFTGTNYMNVNATGSYAGGYAGMDNAGLLANNTKLFNPMPVTGNSYVGNMFGSYSCDAVIVFDSQTNPNAVQLIHTGNLIAAGSAGKYFGGIFGEMNDNKALVQNFVSTLPITGHSYVGGIVGRHTAGVITNCHNATEVTATVKYAGGIAGQSSGKIRNVYNEGAIAGESGGGIVGSLIGDTISACYNTGIITGNTCGGIAGTVTGGTLTASYNLGIITGESSGGVAGTIGNGTVSHSYNLAPVSGVNSGGVAGTITGGDLEYAYNAGVVTGTGSMGAIGTYTAGNINKVVFDIITTKKPIAGGGQVSVTGLATTEMTQLAGVWRTGSWGVNIAGFNTYPYLAWQTARAGISNALDFTSITPKADKMEDTNNPNVTIVLPASNQAAKAFNTFANPASDYYKPLVAGNNSLATTGITANTTPVSVGVMSASDVVAFDVEIDTTNHCKEPLFGSVEILKQPTCGNDNGVIQLLLNPYRIPLTPGAWAYDYSINGGLFTGHICDEDNGVIGNLGAGIYQIEIYDRELNCYDISPVFTLKNIEAAGWVEILSITPASDCGTENGTVSFMVSGVAPPYQYQINGKTPVTTSSLSPISEGSLAVGEHTLTITDGNCVIASKVFTIRSSGNELTFNLGVTNASICGDEGELKIALTGGMPTEYRINGDYWLNWTGTVRTIELPDGVYEIELRNGNCVSQLKTAVIGNGDSDAFTVSTGTIITPYNCQLNNGSIEVTVNGAAGDYFYSMDAGKTLIPVTTTANPETIVIKYLRAGVYNIFFSNDNHDCVYNLYNVEVPQGTTETVDVVSITVEKHPSCKASNGMIKVVVAGNDGTYTYVINGSGSPAPLPIDGILPENLPAGHYTVTVYSAGGCEAQSRTLPLTNSNNEVELEIYQIYPALDCWDDGTIHFTVIGSGNYLYRIDDGPTDNVVNNTLMTAYAKVGDHTITIIDDAGCETPCGVFTIGSVSFTDGTDFSLSHESRATCGGGEGVLKITILDGNPTHYRLNMGAWIPVAGNPMKITVPAGNHEVQLKDGSGCVTETKLQKIMNSENDFIPEITKITPATCDLKNGSAEFFAWIVLLKKYSLDGGLTFVPIDSSVTVIHQYGDYFIGKLAAGIYDFMFEDARGCVTRVYGVQVPSKMDDCNITVDIKLFLEGVLRSDGTMTTYLQGPPRYPGILDKSLPVQNPYTGMPEYYHQINDTLGPAGKVVDWILVELIANVTESGFRVWSYDLIESKALLLKFDGTVVDTNGNRPAFKTNTTDSVYIAVKHRNHLSVLSSVPLLFDTYLKYDFTTGVAQAFKVPWAANQPMKIHSSGLTCLWAGDIWNGLSTDGTRNAINSTDYERFRSKLTSSYILGEYLFEDVNMDGMIDDGDGALISFNQRLNLQSILLYYIKRP